MIHLQTSVDIAQEVVRQLNPGTTAETYVWGLFALSGWAVAFFVIKFMYLPEKAENRETISKTVETLAIVNEHLRNSSSVEEKIQQLTNAFSAFESYLRGKLSQNDNGN
jgi:hypothetical protein